MCPRKCVLVHLHTHTHTHTQKTHPLAKKFANANVRYGCSLLQCKFEKHEQRADDSFQATKYIL